MPAIYPATMFAMAGARYGMLDVLSILAQAIVIHPPCVLFCPFRYTPAEGGTG